VEDIEDLKEIQLTLSDVMDWETARLRKRGFVVNTIGEITRHRKPLKTGDNHPVPKGCQWAEGCEECPWPDCIVSEPKLLPYNSEEARRNREQFVIDLLCGRTSIEREAKRLKVPPTAIERYLNQEYPKLVKVVKTLVEENCSVKELRTTFL